MQRNFIGRYALMIIEVFKNPVKWSICRGLIIREIDDLVYKSMGIINFISLFMGAVIAIQTSLSLRNSFIPKYLIGYTTRQSIILEFSPTLISIIMAGKIGSYITSSIGSMKVSEQIDALKVMGINPLNYLVFPKIISMLVYPFAIAISMGVGLLGGWLASVLGGYCSEADFLAGLAYKFNVFHVVYAFVKIFVFSLILATVPSYHGYYMSGGALDVGKATTISFVWTSVSIIVANYLITQLLLG